ncbi:hypothetical protein ACHAXA_003419 [Cyclostephanos tholiformis]|uniref:Calcineurin-like phosphoesterase domain-containing protein n=1 Tax=Cyclostephanos tholiformis TaxID=382380 RepID=A0ABD3SFS5_9STRA
MSSPFSTPPRQPILPVDDPTEAWERVRSHQVFADPPTAVPEDVANASRPHPTTKKTKTTTTTTTNNAERPVSERGEDRRILRIACISDTHGRHRSVRVPPCDVLIHGGDFTNVGEPETILDVADYFDELRRDGTVREAVICIAGNHEVTFERERYDRIWHRFRLPGQVDKFDVTRARARLEGSCTYLEDGATRVGPIVFYGSPHQPEFGGWAFNVPRGDIDDLWERIPYDVDVLITHGPPLGRGDVTSGNHRVGCVSLMKHVQNRIRPRLHVFGHVHEGYGVYHDGRTAYVNASSVKSSMNYRGGGVGGVGGGGDDEDGINPCVVFDLPYDRDLPALLVEPDAKGADNIPTLAYNRPASNTSHANEEGSHHAPSDDDEEKPRSEEVVECDVNPSRDGGASVNKKRRRHRSSEEDDS